MRGLTQLSSARVISAGHAFIQNLRRGHYELGRDANSTASTLGSFAELVRAI
jgi:transposase, IS6 family